MNRPPPLPPLPPLDVVVVLAPTPLVNPGCDSLEHDVAAASAAAKTKLGTNKSKRMA
jgi:hypothetical protein